jgi:hypothetical protein
MPFGQNKATCSKCGQAYITGDCIDLLGVCDECNGYETHDEMVLLCQLEPELHYLRWYRSQFLTNRNMERKYEAQTGRKVPKEWDK